jgi:hypothetical protein
VTEQPLSEPPRSPASEPPLGAQPAAASTGVDYQTGASTQSLTDRPEAKIAGTFVAGLIAATILKRLAR